MSKLHLLSLLVTSTFVPQERTLNVYAAASLKESFTQIARQFESGHPGVTVRLNFAGSQTLATQIVNGARADVFASAAVENLDAVEYDKGSRRTFVTNRLCVALRSGFWLRNGLRSLPEVGKLVVADKSVPVGRYTEAFLEKAASDFGAAWVRGVRAKIVSREEDVKAVLAKVRLGEADAGVVYVGDVVAAGVAVSSVSIPTELNVEAEYPVAIVRSARNKADAKAFIKVLFDPRSVAAFDRFGLRSVVKPARFLVLVRKGKTSRLPLPMDGKQVVDALELTGAKEVRFVGADGYTQAIAVRTLRDRKAVFERAKDGNYSLVVPGASDRLWVKWLRRIELR